MRRERRAATKGGAAIDKCARVRRRADEGVFMAKERQHRGARSGKSLNLVLWFAFSVFSLVVVVLFVLVQNSLVTQQYREQALRSLDSACAQMTEQLEDGQQDTTTLGRRLYDIANNYGLSVSLFYEDGESVFDFTESVYPELASALQEKQRRGELPSYLRSDDSVAYAQAVAVGQREAYLYVSASVEPILGLESGLRWLSLITALAAVVLSFAASGFVAPLITKPITEVTERAKELARGNYDLHFKKDYYCAELRELSEALEYARSEISKADTMQKELIANVSHDFKTPLTMIKAYASMIREISGDDKKKRDANAQVIIDECDRLTLLVGDLLDLSRLRAGMSKEERTVFNLSEEVYRVAGRFDYLRETEAYRIEARVEDDLYTCGSRDRIEQVMYNLIGNAVNYTGADKLVRVKLYRKGNAARFEVIDSGKGIPPDEIATIWDRYYRSQKTHKRPVSGTGLGLSIVKNILQQHECPFGVISEVGKGSCFWAEFPMPKDGETSAKGGKG